MCVPTFGNNERWYTILYILFLFGLSINLDEIDENKLLESLS